MKKITLLITALILSTNLYAAPHTFNTIYSQSGYWTGSLRVINEFDKAWLVEKDGITKIEKPFEITPINSKEFGFDFGPGATFNVAYTLVLTQHTPSQLPQFVNKTCIFVISATGIAKPDITVIKYDNAQCSYVDTGHGEDFFVL